MVKNSNFKWINDNYGHAEGDECLAEIATSIHDSAMRPADTVARYGGEEFVAVLPGTDLEGATIVANRILKGVTDLKIEHKGSATSVFVSVSIGGSSNGVKGVDDTKKLFLSADNALYQAKNTGRNKVCIASQSGDLGQSKLEIKAI